MKSFWKYQFVCLKLLAYSALLTYVINISIVNNLTSEYSRVVEQSDIFADYSLD